MTQTTSHDNPGERSHTIGQRNKNNAVPGFYCTFFPVLPEIVRVDAEPLHHLLQCLAVHSAIPGRLGDIAAES